MSFCALSWSGWLLDCWLFRAVARPPHHFGGYGVGGAGLGQRLGVGRERGQALGVGHGLQCQAYGLGRGVGVAQADGRALCREGHGVLRLVVFGHVGRRHEYGRHPHEAQLRYAACACAADGEVGGAVGRPHVGYEVGHAEVAGLAEPLQLRGDVGGVIPARLPDELRARGGYLAEVAQHALVHGARPEAAAYDEYGLRALLKPEGGERLGACQLRAEQRLAHGVAREHYLVFGEEALHALVGHADARRLAGQELIGDAGV